MATVNTAFVRYNNEDNVEFKVKADFNVVNVKTRTLYLKLSILNAGNFGWSFADGSTEKNYTLNANNITEISEDLVSSTAPTETSKDVVTFKLEYYKDSNYTTKDFEQTLTLNVNIYIQNSDGTWTSSAYPNEDDIVYDYFDFSGITNVTKSDITGINGKVVMHPYTWDNGSDRFEYVRDVGRYSDYKLLIHQWDDNRLHLEFHNVGNRFVSYVVAIEQGSLDSAEWLGVELKRYPNDTSYFLKSIGLPTNVGSISKALIVPINNYIPCHFSKAKWGGGHDIQVSLDGVYIFNPLP